MSGTCTKHTTNTTPPQPLWSIDEDDEFLFGHADWFLETADRTSSDDDEDDVLNACEDWQQPHERDQVQRGRVFPDSSSSSSDEDASEALHFPPLLRYLPLQVWD